MEKEGIIRKKPGKKRIKDFDLSDHALQAKEVEERMARDGNYRPEGIPARDVDQRYTDSYSEDDMAAGLALFGGGKLYRGGQTHTIVESSQDEFTDEQRAEGITRLALELDAVKPPARLKRNILKAVSQTPQDPLKS